MMAVLALVLHLGAENPAPVAEPALKPVARVLVLDFRDDGAGPESVHMLRDAIATALGQEKSLEVISSEDVRRMISLETDKAATCKGDAGDATTACLAEIGAALGARYIVYGSAARLGEDTAVNMSLTDAETTRTIARRLVQVADRAALAREAQSAARQLFIDSGIVVPVETGPSALFIGGAVGAVTGLVALGSGIALALLSDGVVADTVSTSDEKDSAEGARTLGWVVAGVGTAALGAGATVAVLGWE